MTHQLLIDVVPPLKQEAVICTFFVSLLRICYAGGVIIADQRLNQLRFCYKYFIIIKKLKLQEIVMKNSMNASVIKNKQKEMSHKKNAPAKTGMENRASRLKNK